MHHPLFTTECAVSDFDAGAYAPYVETFIRQAQDGEMNDILLEVFDGDASLVQEMAEIGVVAPMDMILLDTHAAFAQRMGERILNEAGDDTGGGCGGSSSSSSSSSSSGSSGSGGGGSSSSSYVGPRACIFSLDTLPGEDTFNRWLRTCREKVQSVGWLSTWIHDSTRQDIVPLRLPEGRGAMQ